MASRAQFAAALALDLAGAALALLVAGRHWQTIVASRSRPLADDIVNVSGRTLDAACTALGLVALAGVVAVLATRGVARRLVGAVVAAAGIGLVWRSIADLSVMSPQRARTLVVTRHSGVTLSPTASVHVSSHSQWPVLSVLAGALVVAAGVVIALRGHTWLGMSAKYEAPDARRAQPGDPDLERARADATMWSALDRGDDPTDLSPQ